MKNTKLLFITSLVLAIIAVSGLCISLLDIVDSNWPLNLCLGCSALCSLMNCIRWSKIKAQNS